MSRLAIHKTVKMYVNGAFIRSESGRVDAVKSTEGGVVNIPRTSRKDLRNCVEAVRSAQGKWAGRTAFNRGQILYRIGEMMEDRASTLPAELEEVHAAVDRMVHYAGWTDKIGQILSTLNPVAQAYVNYSMVRPLGIVLAVPDPADGLLGIVEATAAPLVMGDTVMVLVPSELGELAAAYSEILHVSDVPAGAVNILTGDVDEALEHAVTFEDLDGFFVFDGSISDARRAAMQLANAQVMRRMLNRSDAGRACIPVELQQLAEVQTVWMSQGVGAGIGGGPAY